MCTWEPASCWQAAGSLTPAGVGDKENYCKWKGQVALVTEEIWTREARESGRLQWPGVSLLLARVSTPGPDLAS